ncbi:hypothetical protein GGR56DRAFT_612594 [Xylariaceae sp. FL0804]|nr:hypothetical protein GGR56DRAFT_612594 [Xylariaceae sp. FL0804]
MLVLVWQVGLLRTAALLPHPDGRTRQKEDALLPDSGFPSSPSSVSRRYLPYLPGHPLTVDREGRKCNLVMLQLLRPRERERGVGT